MYDTGKADGQNSVNTRVSDHVIMHLLI